MGKDKYILETKQEKNKEQFNLDFIQVVKNVKLLIAIPLKIDESKVWIDHYQIKPRKAHTGKKEKNEVMYYNVDMTLTFANQQRMSNKQLEFQMNKVLHKLFGEKVTMESIAVDTNGNSEEDEVEDARQGPDY